MRISIVMPAYNAAAVIRRALDSALAQRLPAHEILVVDDGSSDDTPAIVTSYAPYVTLLRQRNSGPSAARNKAMAAATGDWIAFLDSDDAWHPEKLERQVRLVKRDTRIVSTATIFVYADGRRRLRPAPATDALWPGLRYANGLVTSSILVRRDAAIDAGGFDARLRGCEDWDLWVRVARTGGYASVPDPLVDYYVVPESLSTDYECKLDELELILPTLLEGLSGYERTLCARRTRSAQLYGAAITAREVGHSPLRLILRSLAQWPAPGVMPERYLALVQALMTDRYYGLVSNAVKRYLPGRPPGEVSGAGYVSNADQI
jgi:glycosyltransferase involved in cell wall biosynthesis